ncbi:MAG TPA: SDR family NAD(P)-dependent oxidoreductase [Conexibacter sp.]|nr:SDR family NAD(P)-dependent oxidoreductase [Conexibacter sp.]
MSTSHTDVVEALRSTLREREELREQLARHKEPIAIVGMACRFPGGVRSPQDLWELVASETDAIASFPEDRGWDLDGLYDPDPDVRGAVSTRCGGFVDGVADFDADFFELSPREALAMDPQQRLMLELAWAALEDAGIDPAALAGTPAGVFAGGGATDYPGRDAHEVEGHRLTGSHASVVSGRIAYVLGLEGPTLSVDTACSSSLVAIHLACQALRRGDVPLALTGGATVMSTPWMLQEFSRQRGLAPDGRCKAFGEGADGTGLAEGAGVLVLERLSDALAGRRRVLAVIRGSAINHDGASNGLTAPNGPSQERVIRSALADGDLSPADVDTVEAHGTGTALGDPIEAHALLATYGQGRAGEPLRLGSLKSNIGHAQGAAGVGGVIKMVMALRHGLLPRTLHADTSSSQVDWSAGAVELLTESRPWPRGEAPRRAGVSSFGISGTNAHVILEEAPAAEEPAVVQPDARAPPTVAWLLSAKTEPALRAQARQLRAHLQDRPQARPQDVALSLATGRRHFGRRAAVIGAERDALLAALEAVEQGERTARVVEGMPRAGKTAYMFTGQGAQRPGMGCGLAAAFPLFGEALDAVCEQLDRHLDRPLQELLSAPAGTEEAALLDRTEFTQAALFAVEVALFRLVESLGMRADYLVGHSIGELAAAHVAGVLSLVDASALVAARGRLIGALPDGGGMLAVKATEDELAASLAGLDGQLAIAAVNGPCAVVVSGDVDALDALQPLWEGRGRETKRLRVSHAFHSPRVEPMLDAFRRVAEGLTFAEPRIPIVSSLSGEQVAADVLATPEHWVRHVREPVRFAAAVATLDAAGVRRYLELGPDGALVGMATDCLGPEARERALLVPALRPRRDDRDAFVGFLAAAHVAGVGLDWEAVLAGHDPRRVDLPTYPFQRKRHWIAPRPGVAAGEQGVDGHPVLMQMTPLARGDEWLFTGRLSTQTHAWIGGHVLAGTLVLPGAAFVDLVLAAGATVGCDVVEELTLEAPLLPPAAGGVELQLFVEAPDEAGRRGFGVHSREEGAGEWTAHATGTLGAAAAPEDPLVEPLAAEAWPPLAAEQLDADAIVARLCERVGYEYGPPFVGVRAAWRDGDATCSEVEIAAEFADESARYAIYPALLDLALQAGLGEQMLAEELPPGQGRMLFRWANVRLHATGASRLRVRSVPAGPDAISVAACTEDGRPVFSVELLSTRSVELERLQAPLRGGREPLHRVEWSELARPSEAQEEPSVAVVGELAAGEAQRRCADLATLVGELEAGTPVPAVVLAGIAPGDGDPALRAHTAVHAARALLQGWLAEERLAGSQLLIVTRGAVAAVEDDVPDPALAAVWGLVRSAQSEQPGRFVLVDRDDDGTLPLAAILAAGEPQLALRGGELRAPRLTAMDVRATVERPPLRLPVDEDGTTLITGATGGIGGLLARHLAERGVRHLTLVSRRGAAAESAEQLLGELAERGCEAQLLACDVGDRDACAALVADVSALRPIRSVVHAAGVLDDATIESLTAEQVERVLHAKTDAAWHLYELTEGFDLTAFVLFSSLAALVGAPGQGNYAAANAFLDALAQRARAAGRACTSIAWGPWRLERGMTATIGEPGLARLERMGIEPLAPDAALRLFDRALEAEEAVPVPARLDVGTLRLRARDGTLPAILRGLAPGPMRRAGGQLAQQLADLPEEAWEGALLELVRRRAAAVLGHDSPDAIDPARTFKELGFDSLSAVELRNELADSTGLRLPSTLVFDHPTLLAVAKLLRAEISGAKRSGAVRRPVRTRRDEPVAIVGMGCRYPGGAASPDGLWRLVASGTDAISPFPDDRGWDLERLFDPDPDKPGTSYTREAGWLHDVADFDAGFFGIGRSEALAMDPQQRLMLELAWEALESAGIAPASLRETETGVFAGATNSGYARHVTPEHESFRLTGTQVSVLSGRIAHRFGLEGPAVTIDTACSSSLVAIHLACRSLRQGECSLALAGGITVMAGPDLIVDFARQRGLAPDGRCKSFGAGADGTGFAEGAGLLVLERLSDARERGHRVLAVLRGSAINQDGASNGLTAPNGPSQERVIHAALADAGLSPADVDAVEAHGTGTTLGDPIEAQALLATYGQGRANGPLRLGSIKANIGHTSAGAGVAGVIKMVQALRHELLPPSLHCEEPSPHVDWSAGAVELLREPVDWPAGACPRRAGVSSFGVSGTNAHVILEEAPAEPDAERAVESPALPLVLSAHTEVALRAQAARLATWLAARAELEPVDVAFTLATGRAHLERRAFVAGSGREELIADLDVLARGELGADGSIGSARAGRTAFLFSGQGAQWAGMGSGLYGRFPVFAQALDAVCAELDPQLGRPLRESIFCVEGSPDARSLDRTELTQPALFAVEVALFRLFESWGVRPDLLIGHSVGELVAVHVAGMLSLADACALVAARGRLMGALPDGGAMVAIEASERELVATLAEGGGAAAIAAVNGPRAVVVSGETTAVDALERVWTEHGRRTSQLRVSHAFHSPLMEPMLDELRAVAERSSVSAPSIPIVSNVTGAVATEDLRDPGYWARHAREPVRFADGIAELERLGVTRFVELGPDAALTALARGSVTDELADRGLFVPAMRRGRDQERTLVACLAAMHTADVAVDWHAFFAGTGARRVELPTYAFQRRRHWLDALAGAGQLASAGLAAVDHPLLSARQLLAGSEEWLLTGRVARATHPWIGDHVLLDTVVVPGTAWVDAALAAGELVGCAVLAEITFEAPLVLAEREAAQLQLRVEAPDEAGSRRFSIHSCSEGAAADDDAEWTRHGSGTLAAEADAASSEALEQLAAESWPPAGAEEVDVDRIYERLTGHGFAYGPWFTGVRAAWRRGDELFAEVALDDEHADAAARHALHPALFDAALHGAVELMDDGEDSGGRMLFHWEGARLHAAGATALRVRIALVGEETWEVAAIDPFGAPVASVEQIVSRRVEPEQLALARRSRDDTIFSLDWVEAVPSPGGGAPPRVALIEGEDTALGAEASEAMRLDRHPDLAALERAVADGAPVPEVVLIAAPGGLGDVAADAHAVTAQVLELLQAWLAGDALESARLVVVTRGALAVRDGESPDLAQAAAAGLVRSAASEHPLRFGLVDLGSGDVAVALRAALTSAESELAVREGALLAPRLVRAGSAGTPTPPTDPQGTVLITGGTGGLGALVARHLVGEHGARRLLLTSRRGLEAEGAAELVAELGELGCEAAVAACDVADRGQVEALLAEVDDGHPLVGVVHAAGVLDDGTITSLDAEQLRRVMAPKVDGALHLHELTRDRELSFFVLFSSAAAAFGSPGQGNYAAANAFLDGLAHHRHAQGLVAISVAWGPWEQTTGMVADADLARLARLGTRPLPSGQALTLFDAARGAAQAHLLAIRLDGAALRAQASSGVLSPILRDLVRVSVRRPDDQGSLARQLAAAPEAEWQRIVLDLVCGHIATVLGHPSPQAVDPERSFSDMGFDSLAAVELRNRLIQATGLRLPATVVFDHPTPAAVAAYVAAKVAPSGSRRPALDGELDRLDGLLRSLASDDAERVRRRLRSMLAGLGEDAAREQDEVTEQMIESASADEILELVSDELEKP